MNLVPGLSLRASPAEEEMGMDDCQLGEFAYDYVELTRHVADSGSISDIPAAAAVASSQTSTERPKETV
jgi:Amt family ammonium transporter